MSPRVLEKCAFTLAGKDTGFPDASSEQAEELIMKHS